MLTLAVFNRMKFCYAYMDGSVLGLFTSQKILKECCRRGNC
jgi:hypothetical protein